VLRQRNVGRVDLERFVTAQDGGGSYQHAVAELRKGRKTSHWMWFNVLPQPKPLVVTLMTAPQSAEGPRQQRTP
jgi:uncharacterized protein (DUF1810 family)